MDPVKPADPPEAAKSELVELRALLSALVADIEAMQNRREIYDAGYSDNINNGSEPRPSDFFGPFRCWFDHSDMEDDYGMCEGGNGVSIEWPNLRILMDEAKKLLERT